MNTGQNAVRSLREEVYEHLKTLLNRGDLRPGGYLDLNALERDIGISRTPLRDALLRLESEGFIEILNRRGVRVVELTPERIRWIYELVGGLESAAVLSVAGRITPDVLDRMEELNRDMSRALDRSDFGWYYDDNLAFHDCYLQLSDNPELVRHTRLLKQRLYDFPRREGFVPEWERASLGEHDAIVRALRRGDFRDAADLLRDVHWAFGVQEPYIRRYYAAHANAGAGGDAA